jgi:hypothetical protein
LRHALKVACAVDNPHVDRDRRGLAHEIDRGVDFVPGSELLPRFDLRGSVAHGDLESNGQQFAPQSFQ